MTLLKRGPTTVIVIAFAVALLGVALLQTTASADHGDEDIADVEHGHVLPDFGQFTDIPADAPPGVHLTSFSGGTIGQAMAAAPSATALWATVDGVFVGHIIGAPAFVNVDFDAAFPDGQVPERVYAVVLGEPSEPNYEIWAMDQGTNIIHILDQNHQVADTIDLDGQVQTPHMIDFTSDGAYAFIANTGTGDVVIIRTEDREVVEILETGETAHMAAVVPGDEVALVANIGAASMTEILIDTENETFEIGRELVLADDPMIQERAEEFSGTSPVCHVYTQDGRYAYITLGPALADGGVVVMDTETFELVAVYPVDEVAANCGTALSPDGSKIYVNGGSLEAGEWFVFDTETHELIHSDSSRGLDAHGVRVTPDGSEMWMVNRATSNGIIIDPETDEIIYDIEFTGDSPDIIDFSPDSRYLYVTLRGPEPRSGPHAIAGETPGVSIFDVAARELVGFIGPDLENELSDFHGIGVRTLP